jgi:hypothetical protein
MLSEGQVLVLGECALDCNDIFRTSAQSINDLYIGLCDIRTSILQKYGIYYKGNMPFISGRTFEVFVFIPINRVYN